MTRFSSIKSSNVIVFTYEKQVSNRKWIVVSTAKIHIKEVK